jgi:hypothetical protein
MSLDNLRAMFDRSQPREIEEARASYYRYRDITFRVAEAQGYPGRIGAAVFAALSPNNDYTGNLRDMRVILAASRKPVGIDGFNVATYGNNKRKAWSILRYGLDPLEVITANKTRNFFLNVCNPDDPHPVTIDGHMFWIYYGRRGRVSARGEQRVNAAKVTPRLYEEIAEATRQLAIEKGVITNQAQAILWQTYRRIHNIMRSQQLEIFPKDLAAAGLAP